MRRIRDSSTRLGVVIVTNYCYSTFEEEPRERRRLLGKTMADQEYHQQTEEEEDMDEEAGGADDDDEVSWYRDASQIMAMLSNFSTSYNAVNVSLALPILEVLHPNPEPTAVSAVASSLLAGMMLGQLVGGALGDLVGVNRALLSVMVLQVLASLGSALFCRESFWELSLYRFVLGIGAGGVYPLAAVLSSGQNKSMHKVVLTFAMQGLGFIAVPLVALLLLSTTTDLTLVWRILLGVGGVPGIGDCRGVGTCVCTHGRRRRAERQQRGVRNGASR
jgi:MFS family permease